QPNVQRAGSRNNVARGSVTYESGSTDCEYARPLIGERGWFSDNRRLSAPQIPQLCKFILLVRGPGCLFKKIVQQPITRRDDPAVDRLHRGMIEARARIEGG